MEPLREIRNDCLTAGNYQKCILLKWLPGTVLRPGGRGVVAEPQCGKSPINQLEEELGIQLFVRSHRKVN